MGLLIKNCRIDGRVLGSVYVESGRVAEVYPYGEPQVPPGAEALDANGAALYSGFIDTHCHPFEYGWLKRNVDLRGASNLTALRMRLSARVQSVPRGDWVAGMGWDQEALGLGRMPSRSDIDDICPDNPVVLTRVCGHMALLNTRAIDSLALAGRTGSEYERDGAGILTGIVKEAALEDVYSSLPRSPQTSFQDLQGVELQASWLGLTGMHCILSPEGYKEELEALSAIADSEVPTMKYRVYIPQGAIAYVEERGFRRRLDNDWVKICGVKIYADGSLGARTAALREPYSDDPSNTGMLRQSDASLAKAVEEADSAGYQVIVHAIGDRAIQQALDALSPVSGSGNPRKHRIEHASLLPKDLGSRMGRMGIRATVQPLFITSDTWATSRLGEERVLDLYPFRSMLESGIIISGSSDAPVESQSPILGMWASMVRGGYAKEESLRLDEAVSLYTSAARANGGDPNPGGVKVGMPADLTLLDSDVDGMHPAMLRKVKVAATVAGGSLTHVAI